MSYNGTVRCSHCYQTGHNKRKCPNLTTQLKEIYESESKRVDYYRNASDNQMASESGDRQWNIDFHTRRMDRARTDYMKRTKIDLATGTKVTNKAAKAERMKKVTCGYCKRTGHTRRVCQNVKNDYRIYMERTRQVRQEWYEKFKASGMGIGSMAVGESSGYDSDGQWGRFKVTALVTDINFGGIDAHRPDSNAIVLRSNGALKGVKNCPTLSNLSLRALEEINDETRRTEVQTTVPSGAIPPMPENWLTEFMSIKEVFDTKSDRPWDYKWADSDAWHSQVRERLQLPKCAYDDSSS